jgi:hypothetical protein
MVLPAAKIDGDVFVKAAQKEGLPTTSKSLNKIVKLVNEGMTPSQAAQQIANKRKAKKMNKGGSVKKADITTMSYKELDKYIKELKKPLVVEPVKPIKKKDGGVVPDKYKGFSKLPEKVQTKIDPALAKKYKNGGAVMAGRGTKFKGVK